MQVLFLAVQNELTTAPSASRPRARRSSARSAAASASRSAARSSPTASPTSLDRSRGCRPRRRRAASPRGERHPAAARAARALVSAYSDALTDDLRRVRPDRWRRLGPRPGCCPRSPCRTVEATGVGEAFAAPKHARPAARDRARAVDAGPARRRERILDRLAQRAGVDADRAPVLGARARRRERADRRLRDRRGARGRPRARGRGSASCASTATWTGPARRRADRRPAATSSSGSSAARRERLSELLDGWSPEGEADLALLLSRMARTSSSTIPTALRGPSARPPRPRTSVGSA